MFRRPMSPSHRLHAGACLLAATLLCLAPADQAQAQKASEASVLSLLQVAMVSEGPASSLLAAGASLLVVGVEVSAQGTMWVLERAADGARATLRIAGRSSVAVGTTITVSAMTAGWVLSAAGQAVACVPDASAAALLYNERVTR